MLNILYFGEILSNQLCVHHPIDVTIYRIDSGCYWSLIYPADVAQRAVQHRIIVYLSMVYSGYCERERFGGISPLTIETGRIPTDVFAVGEIKIYGVIC